jgi:hypothetical protein
LMLTSFGEYRTHQQTKKPLRTLKKPNNKSPGPLLYAISPNGTKVFDFF